MVDLEMQVAVRAMSMDEKMASLEVVLTDLERGDLDDTGRVFALKRKRVLEEDIEQCIRILAVPDSRAAKYAADREAWAELAREVRQRVDIAEVLLLVGFPPRQIGRELHGPCPACRDGDDRLLVRSGPEGRCWCRRCGFRGDAISVVRSFMPGMSGFRDAVRTLARLASMNVEVK